MQAIAMYWVPYGVARLGCGSAKYGQLGDEEDDLSSPPVSESYRLSLFVFG